MKKNICFVVATPFTAKAFLVKHFMYLSKDFDIYLVANFKDVDQSIFSDIPLKGIHSIDISRGISIFKDFKALVSLTTYFRKMQFDAVHTVTPKAGLLGISASRIAGINKRIHIFTGQVWHTQKGYFKKLLIFLDRFIVSNATDILVDGESQRQYLIINGIVKDSNSFVLGKGSISGVDTNRFIPSEFIKKQVRNELEIKDNEIVFMFLGRLNQDKGIRELAFAFQKLLLIEPNCKLLLVGEDEGNMIKIVSDAIEDKGKFIFYGKTSEPERILQACDVFCLPSHREGFGTCVIEASLLEKAVICSDTYGLMETIIEGKTGLRHKVSDIESLYEKMKIVVDNQELRNSLGKEGREYVLENFSADVISKHWVKFYKEIKPVYQLGVKEISSVESFVPCESIVKDDLIKRPEKV